MKIVTMFFLPILILISSSCDRSTCDDEMQMPPCELNYEGPLDIVWYSLLRSDSSQYSSIPPAIYDNDILFNNNSLGELNTIYSLNPETGEKQWEWDDFPSGNEFSTISDLTPSQIFDDKLYFNHGIYKILFDVTQRNKVWESATSFAESDITRIDNYLYYIQYFDELGGDVISGSEIRRVREDHIPGWESVFRLDDQHIFRLPAPWINSVGDTLLIFRSSNFPFPGTVDAFAYNISEDELAWSITGFSNFSGTKHAPIIYEDKAYFQMQRGIACIDLNTGMVLWETPDLEDTFTACNFILGNETIVIHGDEKQKTFGIDVQSGQINWVSEDSGKSASNMQYWGGGVYYKARSNFTGHLYGYDIQTGEEFLKEPAPFTECLPNTIFAGMLSIDASSGRMYTIDGIFAYCIQLEER